MAMNEIRKRLFPKLHPLDGYIGMKIIPPKGEQRDLIRERGDEYVLSVSCSEAELRYALSLYGYAPNSLSTLKYVKTDDGKVWEEGSMAYRPSLTSKFMHHAYWFPAAEEGYTYHISHHKERNYLDFPKGPFEHTSNEYRWSGDPDGHLYGAVNESGIAYKILDDEEY